MSKFYERKNIHEMDGYTPGEQPQSLNVIKLNTNENPYTPCEAVMNALKYISPENLRRYPPPDCPAFRRVAAQYHGVDPNQIILTNGGDELLRLLITTFVEPGEKIGMATPSYSLYPVLAKVNNSDVFEIPLNDDWSVPNDFAKRMNDAQAKLVFLVSPHAPSGYLVPIDQLRNVAQQLNGILVVDEAYIDFLDPEIQHPSIELLELGNVVLLRSFSKGYSLAGLRCGYGIGHVNLILPMLTKTKDSYNMDYVAQIIAQTSLENSKEASKTWFKVRQERARLRSSLEELGMWTVASQSNFVLATVPATFSGGAKSVYLKLKEKNIFVRYWDQPKLSDKLRITVGTAEENSALLEALNKIKHESL